MLLLLLLLRRRRLSLLCRVLGMLLRERLSIGAIQLLRWRPLVPPDGMRRYKCLCLRRDGRENAFLRKSLAVGAASIFRLIETRATNLGTKISIEAQSDICNHRTLRLLQ